MAEEKYMAQIKSINMINKAEHHMENILMSNSNSFTCFLQYILNTVYKNASFTVKIKEINDLRSMK